MLINRGRCRSAAKKKLKSYPIGFFHIDIAELDASKNWPSYGVSDSIALKESETSRCAASLDFLMLLSV
jgi:hypothetical protein